nr:ACP S-malonyltransferase [Nakamurella aerolata]
MAIVAPGQGAQKPGMLSAWLELPGVAEQLTAWGDAAGLDLARLGTTADADEIKDTAVTQPLVVATALLAAGQLSIPSGNGTVVAGHSVGELAAAAVAGVISADEATALAATRGRAMAAASALTPTSMAAVMNPDIDAVLATLNERDLVGANVNGAGQVVAAGTRSQIDELVAAPPEGMRVIALSVAGAFHTAYMEPAREEFAGVLAQLRPADPTAVLLTNADGRAIGSGGEYLELLSRQLTSPVRWDKCMDTIAELGVTGLLELPPAGTLVGLAKRQLKGVATLAVKSPDDLPAAAAFITEHAGAAA